MSRVLWGLKEWLVIMENGVRMVKMVLMARMEKWETLDTEDSQANQLRVRKEANLECLLGMDFLEELED